MAQYSHSRDEAWLAARRNALGTQHAAERSERCRTAARVALAVRRAYDGGLARCLSNVVSEPRMEDRERRARVIGRRRGRPHRHGRALLRARAATRVSALWRREQRDHVLRERSVFCVEQYG